MSGAVNWHKLGAWSPAPSLKRAADAKWLVEGVIPAGGIVWLVASPESFKTFVALDMAAAVARGGDWLGRKVKPATSLFVAAEGGENVHVRRAAADLAAGAEPGPLAVIQMRPRLDEPSGLVALQALLYQATGGYGRGLKFHAVQEFESFDYRLGLLTDAERSEWERRIDEDDSFDEMAYVDEMAAKHYGPRDQAIDAALCALSPEGPSDRPLDRVLLVIDTFSQTSADDTKATVSRFVKSLRDLQDAAASQGCEVTVLVLDHTTKSGDTYMGSGAKEGDCDAMLELDRHGGSMCATLSCAKMKDAAHFPPVQLELQPIEIPGYADAVGRPLTSLVVGDGERAHRLRRLVGGNGPAAVLLDLLEALGPCTQPQLRQAFDGAPANAQRNADAKRMSFKRALEDLQQCGVASVLGDTINPTAKGAA